MDKVSSLKISLIELPCVRSITLFRIEQVKSNEVKQFLSNRLSNKSFMNDHHNDIVDQQTLPLQMVKKEIIKIEKKTTKDTRENYSSPSGSNEKY